MNLPKYQLLISLFAGSAIALSSIPEAQAASVVTDSENAPNGQNDQNSPIAMDPPSDHQFEAKSAQVKVNPGLRVVFDEIETLHIHAKPKESAREESQEQVENTPNSEVVADPPVQADSSVEQTDSNTEIAESSANENAKVSDSTKNKKEKSEKQSPGGLPKNTRQVAEGYWIGSMPYANNVPALNAHKIQLVITASRTQEDLTPLKDRLNEFGIKHLMVPFGSKFPKPSKFLKPIAHVNPENIFIHCDHGGDRSGAMLAYLLVKNHHWKIQHALLAVLYPGDTDIKGLTSLLNERGYTISQDDIDRYLGIYSASKNGGGGGLKVRSEEYKKLINTMLNALEQP